MQAVPEDRLSDALKQLDPVSRALLDLSIRRGIPDDEIAGIVGTDAERISSRRDEVLGELAATLGLTGADDVVRVRDALKEMDWRTGRREFSGDGPPGEAERQGQPRRPKPETDHTLGKAQERSIWMLLGAAVVSVLFAVRRRT